MTKHKLERFAENETFRNVFQPVISYPPVDDEMKGNWNKNYFKNDRPVILELGCGRGEYTVNLAEMYPQNNYIGIDYKGARLWRGAKTAIENNMDHVAFLRLQIQRVGNFFSPGEVSEIWITFPDPQPRQSREHKRLTSPEFIGRYRNILKKNGTIHLKTDNAGLYEYTLGIIKENNFSLMTSTNDLYQSPVLNEVLAIQTTYEKIFLAQGSKICYIQFCLS
ncbi:MAG: tRNA (guanosine(46)-N7)-methyltransferase TrmB [Bacteroidetes bacterium]|nr:tRNA (guanosine(46)-N7)-methyltransferase TrmB [Bacteroidota bacterium]